MGVFSKIERKSDTGKPLQGPSVAKLTPRAAGSRKSSGEFAQKATSPKSRQAPNGAGARAASAV